MFSWFRWSAPAQSANVRNAAAASLKETIDQLNRYKSKGNLSSRLLQQKIDAVTEAQENLTSKHYAFVEETGCSVDDEVQVLWLKERIDEAVDAADEVYLLIDSIENTTKADQDKAEMREEKIKKRRLVEMQYQADEMNLREKLRDLVDIIGGNRKTHEDCINARELLKDVEDALLEQIKSSNALKEMANDNAELKIIFEKESEIRKTVASKRALAISFIGKIEAEDTESNASTPVACPEVVESIDCQMKSGELITPTFSGDLRKFPKFKQDFEAEIVPQFPNKAHQTHIMKYWALKEEVKEIVEDMDDIDDIWLRLEILYGDETEVSNNKDIEGLRFSEQDFNRGIVNLLHGAANRSYLLFILSVVVFICIIVFTGIFTGWPTY